MVDQAEFWNSQAAMRNDRPRPLESARCSLCGIELPKGLMMPDGGRACDDVLWYCRATKSCTERWTAHPPRATVPARIAAPGPPAPKAPQGPLAPERPLVPPAPKGRRALEAPPAGRRPAGAEES